MRRAPNSSTECSTIQASTIHAINSSEVIFAFTFLTIIPSIIRLFSSKGEVAPFVAEVALFAAEVASLGTEVASFSRQIVVTNSALRSISGALNVPLSLQLVACLHFRLRRLAAYPRHAAMALLGCEDVGHGIIDLTFSGTCLANCPAYGILFFLFGTFLGHVLKFVSNVSQDTWLLGHSLKISPMNVIYYNLFVSTNEL